MSHIAVERNRRRQMNDHLKVLRSLTPAFYIKRGDQASIIGGAIDFIKELQTLLQSLEAQKKRRQQPQAHLISPASASGGSFSPSPTPSPRSLITSCSPTATAACFSSSSSSAGSSSCISPKDNKPPPPPPPQSQQLVAELAACCNSPMADVEARISGANVLLRTLSRRGPPAVRIIALLESLHLEVLHLNITTMDDTVLYSFVLNIGLDCHLSVDDLAMEVHQTFCCIMPPPPAAHPDHHLDS